MVTYGDYKNTEVWRRAMDLAEEAYRLSAFLPDTEKCALADQMKRSAILIPSQIAAAQKRPDRKAMMQCCGTALGSVAELETQLLLGQKLYNLKVAYALRTCEAVSERLTVLTNS